MAGNLEVCVWLHYLLGECLLESVNTVIGWMCVGIINGQESDLSFVCVCVLT